MNECVAQIRGREYANAQAIDLVVAHQGVAELVFGQQAAHRHHVQLPINIKGLLQICVFHPH